MKIGVDIGGSKIQAGLIRNGQVIEKIIVKTPSTKKKVIEQILFVIDLLNSSKVNFIGLGVPGPGDYSKGVVKTPNTAINNVNLLQIVSNKFKKKVLMQNDASCFVLGESIRLNCKNVVGLTLGTGIGGGIVIDGKLYVGKGNAGELGHCCIKFDGREGFVKGDVSSYGDGKSIKKIYGKDAKDLKSKRAWNDIGKIYGIAIANIYRAFDPDCVVLGGGIANAFTKFKVALNKELKKRGAKVTVIVGDENSAIIGAGNLV